MKYCSVVVLLCLAFSASADTLFGVYAGAGTWQHKTSGTIETGPSAIDVEDDLGLDEDLGKTFYLALEHGIPALPNIMLNHTSFSADGAATLSAQFDLNGTTFEVSDSIVTSVQLSQQDVVLYYQLLDNWLSVDAGIAVRWLDGRVEVYSSTTSGNARIKGPVPLFYGKLRVDLPLTGLWLAADAKGMSYDSNQIIDAQAVLGWESSVGLGIEAGWRTYMLKLAEFDQVNQADIRVQGPFASLNYHF